MKSIQEVLTKDHRDCDQLFADAESAVAKSDLAAARAAFARLNAAMQRHVDVEEKLLFPVFEERTGERLGPTEVMRREHKMMQDVIGNMDAALAQQDAQRYLGLSETLLVLMQQHNVKEESVLYAMIDQLLSADLENMIERLHAAGIG
jgi:hemerythrin-like domain-containing protein